MNIDNTAVTKLMDELDQMSIEIKYNNLSLNGFNNKVKYEGFLSKCLVKAKNELDNNMLLLDERSKESYLKRIQYRLQRTGKELSDLDQLFRGEGDPNFNGVNLDHPLYSYYLEARGSTFSISFEDRVISSNHSLQIDKFIVSKIIILDAFISYLKNIIEIEGIDNSTIAYYEDKITTKQQLLLIHYLVEAGLFKLNDIHGDLTKQANFISFLLNRSGDNVYKNLKKLKSVTSFGKTYLTKENLIKVKEVFQNTDQIGIQEMINKELKKLDKTQ